MVAAHRTLLRAPAAKTENLVARAGDEIGRVCERTLHPVRSVL